jgi:DNA-binding NarL/FixJ family response regulator
MLKMLFDVEIVGVGGNGFEALELTAEKDPDLLIMDVNMPVLDGVSAAGLIRNYFPTTTILMMSADDSPEMRDRCLSVGADAFTPKRWLTKQVAAIQSGLM